MSGWRSGGNSDCGVRDVARPRRTRAAPTPSTLLTLSTLLTFLTFQTVQRLLDPQPRNQHQILLPPSLDRATEGTAIFHLLPQVSGGFRGKLKGPPEGTVMGVTFFDSQNRRAGTPCRGQGRNRVLDSWAGSVARTGFFVTRPMNRCGGETV